MDTRTHNFYLGGDIQLRESIVIDEEDKDRDMGEFEFVSSRPLH